MRTVVVGNRSLAKHVLRALLREGWNVVGTVSAAGEAAHEQAGHTSFRDVADRHDLALIETADINDDRTRDRLAALDPDLCICPGWHQVIDRHVLEVPTDGFVGFHASDLPRGRGGAPVNWTIIHGASKITLSLFYYAPGVDAGDVIRTQTVPIEQRDDVATVLDRLALAACDLLGSTRESFRSRSVAATPQPLADATYRPRRQPQDGVIDWTLSATALRDRVRAQTDPYPGAFSFHDGDRVRVWTATEVSRSVGDATPGTVLGVIEGAGVDVATGRGALRLERIQEDDEPRMWADDLADRRGLTPGDSLGRNQAPPSWLHTCITASDGTTDFASASNCAVGERGEIHAVVEAASERTVAVTATFDGDPLHETLISVEGRKAVPIDYQPSDTGTHTLRVDFSVDGSRVDRRVLKVFTPE